MARRGSVITVARATSIPFLSSERSSPGSVPEPGACCCSLAEVSTGRPSLCRIPCGGYVFRFASWPGRRDEAMHDGLQVTTPVVADDLGRAVGAVDADERDPLSQAERVE